MPKTPDAKYKSLPYIAGYTGFSESYIRKLISQNNIPHYKFEKRYMFIESEIDAWFSERKIDPQDKNVILVANQKGGVGKTSLTFNLGYNLSTLGYKVLLVDMDPQGSLSFLFGAKQTTKNTIHGMFKEYFEIVNEEGRSVESKDIHKFIYNTDELKRKIIDEQGELTEVKIAAANKNLNLIPADFKLIQYRNTLETDMLGREILSKCLKPIKKEFDFIIIDTLPSDLGVLLQSCLMASNYVIIPEYPDGLTLDAMDGLIRVINNAKAYRSRGVDDSDIELLGVAITRMKKNTVLHQEFVKQLQQEYFTFKNTIADTIEIQEATTDGTPLVKFKSKYSDEYQLLLDEIIETIKTKKDKR